MNDDMTLAYIIVLVGLPAVFYMMTNKVAQRIHQSPNWHFWLLFWLGLVSAATTAILYIFKYTE